MNTKKKRNTKKKGKDKKESVPVPNLPPLSWNIYDKKHCRYINRAGYNNVCELIDCLRSSKQYFVIFRMRKVCKKKSERGDSGMGQHGQWLNTVTCFSVSSDDKLVLFWFPGIPTGDPALVAFYDKRIYKKLWLKELSLSDPLYHGKKQHRNMTK